jgi:N-acetylneuraminic acid mutarotase
MVNQLRIQTTLAAAMLMSGVTAVGQHSFGQFKITWSDAPRMPFPASDMTATATETGGLSSIFLIGGCVEDQIRSGGPGSMFICPKITDKCSAFAVSERAWTPCAPAPRERYRHAAANVAGKIWLVGGRDGMDNLIKEVDVYDPSTNKWTTPGTWANATSDLAAFSMANDLYMIGGYDETYTAHSSIWHFDTTTVGATITPVKVANMAKGRGDIAAVMVDNKAYVTGGFHQDDWCNAMESVEVFDLATKAWSTLAPLKVGRADKALVSLNNRVFAIGGERNINCSTVSAMSQPVDDVEVYDPLVNQWKTDTKFPQERFRFVATAHPYSSSIIIFGGQKALNRTCGAKGECYAVDDSVVVYSENFVYDNSPGFCPVHSTMATTMLALLSLAFIQM